MRILDMNGIELDSPDLSRGYLTEEEILIAHHDAVEAVQEQWHYEITAVYHNGGKDVAKVVDVPGVAAKDAWDEYETIQRYIPYTEEELAAQAEATNKEKNLLARVAELEEQLAAAKILLGVE